MKKPDVDAIVRNFQSFLVSGWDAIQKVNQDWPYHEDLINEWCQANWELMVESLVLSKPNEYLEFYWEGADINSPSSRVWFVDAKATHRIFCKSKSNEKIKDYFTGELIGGIEGLLFESFVRFVEPDRCSIEPPFDFVLLEEDKIEYKQFLVNCEDIIFDCKPFQSS